MKKIFLIAIFISAVVGSLATIITIKIIPEREKTANELITEFYDIENAVYISPHSLRQKMSKGEANNYTLVDLRSQQEYEKEHIISAINIPAYKDPNTSAYDEQERIIRQFNALPKNKEVIVYCYSMPCMTGRKIGKMLADSGIYVKHLGIGWNEWRYYWDLWNHDGETPTKFEDFIASGKEPGVPKATEFPSPCSEGGFGC